jgi:hypothetical protein
MVARKRRNNVEAGRSRQVFPLIILASSQACWNRIAADRFEEKWPASMRARLGCRKKREDNECAELLLPLTSSGLLLA